MIIRGELNLMILCGYLFLDISLTEGGAFGICAEEVHS